MNAPFRVPTSTRTPLIDTLPLIVDRGGLKSTSSRNVHDGVTFSPSFHGTIESVTFGPARSHARWPAVAALLASIAAAGCADSSTTTAPTTAGLASIVLSSSSVVGGTPVTAVLTLTTTAPAGGAAVSLASSSAAVVVPASVTIPEGTNTLSFSVA